MDKQLHIRYITKQQSLHISTMHCMVLVFIYIFALQTTLYRIILGNRIQKQIV